MRLTTPRLILREFAEDDWEPVLAYQSDPRYLQFYPWTERNETDAREFVGRFLAQQRERPRTRFQLALELPGEARLIGNCGVRITDPGLREGDLGYELSPVYWGQGLATEAARELLRFGFEELNLHRIWACCVAENQASARVLEKVGMRPEGYFQEKEFFKGRWWDQRLFALLESEWKTRTPAPPPLQRGGVQAEEVC